MAESWTIAIKADHPKKKVIVNLNPNTTFEELFQQASQLLEIKKEDISKYVLSVVGLGKDVVELGHVPPAELLKGKVTNKSTLFFFAPPELRPERKKAKAKGDKKQERKEEKVPNPYEGITPANIFEKIDAAHRAKDDKELDRCWKFVDVYTKQIMGNGSPFHDIPIEMLVDILKRDTLTITEVDLFERIVAWGKGQLAKIPDPPKGAAAIVELKKILAPVLPHIRFLVLTTQDIGMKVNPQGLLEKTQVLELFTYLGRKEAGQTPNPGKSIALFSSKPREGRRPPAWFKFSEYLKHPSLHLESNGSVVRGDQNQNMLCAGTPEIKEGVWEYELKINSLSSHGTGLVFGFINAQHAEFSGKDALASTTVPGWGLQSNGQKAHTSSPEGYTNKFSNNDTVRVRADLEKRTVEYWVNDKHLGVAFTDLVGPVRAAVSLYGTTAVTLQFPKL